MNINSITFPPKFQSNKKPGNGPNPYPFPIGEGVKNPPPCGRGIKGAVKGYLFTWKVRSPFSKNLTIWLAAASPALMLASEVSAPIFFLVAW